MGERVYERMFRFEFRFPGCPEPLVVRVWAAPDAQKGFVRMVLEPLALRWPSLDTMTIAQKLADELRHTVNAVEVLEPSGDGALAYNDWP